MTAFFIADLEQELQDIEAKRGKPKKGEADFYKIVFSCSTPHSQKFNKIYLLLANRDTKGGCHLLGLPC